MNPLSILFSANFVLIIIDAALGWHAAPHLMRRARGGESEREPGSGGIPRLLAFMVALYMFLNCLGWFRCSLPLLIVVSCLALIDIVAQLVARRRLRREKRS